MLKFDSYTSDDKACLIYFYKIGSWIFFNYSCKLTQIEKLFQIDFMLMILSNHCTNQDEPFSYALILILNAITITTLITTTY